MTAFGLGIHLVADTYDVELLGEAFAYSLDRIGRQGPSESVICRVRLLVRIPISHQLITLQLEPDSLGYGAGQLHLLAFDFQTPIPNGHFDPRRYLDWFFAYSRHNKVPFVNDPSSLIS